MGVVSGKLGQGFEYWWAFRKDADIEADTSNVELYVKSGFFKDAAMLFEEITWYRGFPSSCTAGTWTGNTSVIPASQQGHNYNQAERQLYPL